MIADRVSVWRIVQLVVNVLFVGSERWRYIAAVSWFRV
jgi:hypothetical protein